MLALKFIPVRFSTFYQEFSSSDAYLESVRGLSILYRLSRAANHQALTFTCFFLVTFRRCGNRGKSGCQGEGGSLRRWGEPLPLYKELLQRRPRLRRPPRHRRRGPQAPTRYLLHRREAGVGRNFRLGPSLRLQPKQVWLQGALEAARRPRDPLPRGRAHSVPQG